MGWLARWEPAAIVGTPAVALSVVAWALFHGGEAETRVRGARVSGGVASGRDGVSLQFVVLEGGRGTEEPVAGLSLKVDVRHADAAATWTGTTNAEGVAEGWFGLPDVHPGDAITFHATDARGELLADGPLTWSAVAKSALPSGEVPALRRAGDLAIEVYVRSGKLVPNAPESVFVHVTDAVTHDGVDAALTFGPEPGLSLDGQQARTADGGWGEVHASAEFLVAEWTIDARSVSTAPVTTTSGTWYGRLPVAAGAASVVLPESIPAAAPYPITLRVPVAIPRLFVEVSDAAGRDFGSAVDVVPRGGFGLAEVTLPPLRSGTYWLITSSDPAGAEAMTGATLARPFDVGLDGPTLRTGSAFQRPTFARPLSFDGLARPRLAATVRRRAGLRVALLALALASAIELWLVWNASQRAGQKLRRVRKASDADGLRSLEEPNARGGVLILAVLTLLGFALIAALLLVRASGDPTP